MKKSELEGKLGALDVPMGPAIAFIVWFVSLSYQALLRRLGGAPIMAVVVANGLPQHGNADDEVGSCMDTPSYIEGSR